MIHKYISSLQKYAQERRCPVQKGAPWKLEHRKKERIETKKKYCVLKIPEDKLYTWMAREI